MVTAFVGLRSTAAPVRTRVVRVTSAVRADPWGVSTSLPFLAAVLVVTQLVLRGWALSGAWFWQDDFVYTDLARREPLLDFVLSDYRGHLQIGQFLLVDLLAALAPLGWPAHAAVLLGLQLVADLVFLLVCLELFGRRRAVLVPLAVYLFCPITLTPLLWWAAGLQALPLQIALGILLLCHVRLARPLLAPHSLPPHLSGSRPGEPRREPDKPGEGGDARRGLRLGAAVTFTVALLFWGKAALLLLVVVLVELLWLRDGPVRERVVAAARDGGWLWIGYLAALVGYAGLYVTVAQPESSTAAGLVDVLRLLRETIATTAVPGLLGGPWRGNDTLQTLSPPAPHPWDWFAWQAGALILLASLRLSGRWAVRAWAVPIVVLAVDVVAVAATRISFFGPVIGRDPRYIAEVVPLAALALGMAFLRPTAGAAGEDEPPSGWTSWPRWGRTAALLAVLTFYVNSASISTHAAALDRRDSVAKRWVTTAREELREKPYTTVFDAPVPGQVVASVFLDASWASRVLGTLPEGEDRFNRTTDRLGVFDADGRLRGVEIVAATRSGVGPIPGCGWALSGETVGIPLPRRLRASDWVVRIGYYTATGAAARVDVGRDRFSVQVPPGLGYLYVFPRHAVDDVSVTGVDVDTPVCVANVTVGRAWPRER